jgi:hypothetical protein
MVDHPVRVKAGGFGPLDQIDELPPIVVRSSMESEARTTTACLDP